MIAPNNLFKKYIYSNLSFYIHSFHEDHLLHCNNNSTWEITIAKMFCWLKDVLACCTFQQLFLRDIESVQPYLSLIADTVFFFFKEWDVALWSCPITVLWVIRSIPHGGHTELFIIPASAPQLVWQRPWYVLSCLWCGAHKRSIAAYRKE